MLEVQVMAPKEFKVLLIPVRLVDKKGKPIPRGGLWGFGGTDVQGTVPIASNLDRYLNSIYKPQTNCTFKCTPYSGIVSKYYEHDSKTFALNYWSSTQTPATNEMFNSIENADPVVFGQYDMLLFFVYKLNTNGMDGITTGPKSAFLHTASVPHTIAHEIGHIRNLIHPFLGVDDASLEKVPDRWNRRLMNHHFSPQDAGIDLIKPEWIKVNPDSAR